MGMKRYLCLLFACIAIFSCIPAQAAAADIGVQHQLSDGIWGNRYHYGILFSGISECRLRAD